MKLWHNHGYLIIALMCLIDAAVPPRSLGWEVALGTVALGNLAIWLRNARRSRRGDE